MDEKDQIIVMKMMRQPNSANNTVTSPSRALSIHKDSMSMLSKPKIRIIHVFAPVIIKTDTANFRDLVQRLTGKPAADHGYGHNSKKNKVNMAREVSEPRQVVPEKPKPRKAEPFDVFRGLGLQERPMVAAKEEQGSNYLKNFADLDDGFMHDLQVFQSPPYVDAPQHVPYFDATTTRSSSEVEPENTCSTVWDCLVESCKS